MLGLGVPGAVHSDSCLGDTASPYHPHAGSLDFYSSGLVSSYNPTAT